MQAELIACATPTFTVSHTPPPARLRDLCQVATVIGQHVCATPPWHCAQQGLAWFSCPIGPFAPIHVGQVVLSDRPEVGPAYCGSLLLSSLATACVRVEAQIALCVKVRLGNGYIIACFTTIIAIVRLSRYIYLLSVCVSSDQQKNNTHYVNEEHILKHAEITNATTA